MKQLTITLLLVVATLTITSCADSTTSNDPPATEKPCGTFDGKQLYRDGSSCYYYEGTARTKRYLNIGNCEC